MEFAELLITGNSFTEWAGGFLSDVDSLVKTALAIVGVVVAVIIISKNPTVGRSVIGIVVGAFIWALPYLIPMVGDMVRGDVSAAPSVVQEVPVLDTTPAEPLEISK